jgi:hypothetical protein
MTHPVSFETKRAKPATHSMQPSKLPTAIGTAAIRFTPQAAVTGHSLSTKHIAPERIRPVADFTASPCGHTDPSVRQTATEARPETHQNLIHTCKDRTSRRSVDQGDATATRTRISPQARAELFSSLRYSCQLSVFSLQKASGKLEAFIWRLNAED